MFFTNHSGSDEVGRWELLEPRVTEENRMWSDGEIPTSPLQEGVMGRRAST
jgi:hypothetical protein